MKSRLLLLICLVLGSSSVWSQQGTGSLTFSSPKGSDDSALGSNRAVVVFITPYEGFTIVAVDKRDLVMKSTPQNDGTFSTQVMCDLSDRAADRNHNFRVNIAGTALGDYVKVPLVAGKRFTIQVKQAMEHDLYFNYPNTQRVYTDASKSAIEFSVPDYIKDPKVEFTKGIGRLLPQTSASGINIITLEIDCESLKKLLAEIPTKRAEAETRLKKLQADMAALERNFDEHSSDPAFDFDADEKRKAELEEDMEHVYDNVSEVIVVLYADKSNVVRVERQRLAGLTEPRQRLQINVGDGMHKETVFKEASFEELLEDARYYILNYRNNFKSSYYDAALNAYKKAIEHNDCPFELREPLRLENDTLAYLHKYTLYHEKADTLVRKNESEKGFASEEVWKWLLADHKFLDLLIQEHPEMDYFKTLDNQVQNRISAHPNAKKQVQEIVTLQAQRIKGTVRIDNKYLDIPLNSISVYASPYSTIKKDDRKQLRLIGQVDANGQFNVIIPHGMHYIILDQEMKKTSEAHYISDKDTEIEIVIK